MFNFPVVNRAAISKLKVHTFFRSSLSSIAEESEKDGNQFGTGNCIIARVNERDIEKRNQKGTSMHS